MVYLSPEDHRSIQENDLNQVFFSDPLSEVARKAKRNLMVVSFIAILVATLELEISGFLGLQAKNLNLGNSLAQGLAAAVVLYLLVSFLLHVYIDCSAWKFRRELQATEPYLKLLRTLESHLSTLKQQASQSVSWISKLKTENPVDQKDFWEQQIGITNESLRQVKEGVESLENEFRPTFASWKKLISGMDRLSWRLKARFFQLCFIDIGLPILIALLALWECYPNIGLIFARLFG
jgi:hypothetical protein